MEIQFLRDNGPFLVGGGGGQVFSVPQVILPLGPAITVPLVYCVHRICSITNEAVSQMFTQPHPCMLRQPNSLTRNPEFLRRYKIFSNKTWSSVSNSTQVLSLIPYPLALKPYTISFVPSPQSLVPYSSTLVLIPQYCYCSFQKLQVGVLVIVVVLVVQSNSCFSPNSKD